MPLKGLLHLVVRTFAADFAEEVMVVQHPYYQMQETLDSSILACYTLFLWKFSPTNVSATVGGH